MKKAIQAKNLSRFLFLLRNCKYTHFTLDKSGFNVLTVLVERRCADTVKLAARKHRL